MNMGIEFIIEISQNNIIMMNYLYVSSIRKEGNKNKLLLKPNKLKSVTIETIAIILEKH